MFELPGGGVMRHHDHAWIRELFSGFERLSYKEIPVMTMNGNPAKGFQFFGKKKGKSKQPTGATVREGRWE